MRFGVNMAGKKIYTFIFGPVCLGPVGYSYFLLEFQIRACHRTSLVAQWIKTHLPGQGTQVRSLVWEDPTCFGITNPCTEPTLQSLCSITGEAAARRRPSTATKSSPAPHSWRKPPHSNKGPVRPKNNIYSF